MLEDAPYRVIACPTTPVAALPLSVLSALEYTYMPEPLFEDAMLSSIVLESLEAERTIPYPPS